MKYAFNPTNFVVLYSWLYTTGYLYYLQSSAWSSSYIDFYSLPQPEVCVFVSACLLRRLPASSTTGIVAMTLIPARTHAMISMIFNSWHSVNPPRICPTPCLHKITPHIWWMRTPLTIHRIVEMTRNVYSILLLAPKMQHFSDSKGVLTVWNMEWKNFCAQCRPI